MKSNPVNIWQNVRRWLPGVIISIIALAVVFKVARWEEFVLAFSTIRYLNLSIAILLLVISLLTRALAWWTLLEQRPPFIRTFHIINIGYLLNNLLPLRAGEIGRALLMGKVTGLSPFHILSTILIERAFDMAMAAGILLATLPLALSVALGVGVEWAKPVAILTLIMVIVGLFCLYLAARYHQKVKKWVTSFGEHSSLVQRFIVPQLESLLDGLSILTQPKRFIVSVFWIIICWLLYVSIYYIMLLPIVPNAPYWWALFSDGVVALGVAVPSAPGGLGVWEASIVGSLSILGVSTSAALAYALSVHLLNFVVIGILGFLGLIKEGQSLSTLFSAIQREKSHVA